MDDDDDKLYQYLTNSEVPPAVWHKSVHDLFINFQRGLDKIFLMVTGQEKSVNTEENVLQA
jgi:hypothetical protein